MTHLLQVWTSLSPTEQAAAIGVLVSVLMGVVRRLRPAWFSSSEDTARFARMLTSVLTCGVAVLASQLAAGAVDWAQFALAWVVAYGGAETVHTVTARTTGAITQVKKQALAEINAALSLWDWG